MCLVLELVRHGRNDRRRLALQLAEPVNLFSEARRQLRLFSQVRSQSFANLSRDCSAVCAVDVNAVAHNRAFVLVDVVRTIEGPPTLSSAVTFPHQMEVRDRRLWLSVASACAKQRALAPLAIRDARRRQRRATVSR